MAELEALLIRGQEILAVCGWNGLSYQAFRPGGVWVLKFRAEALALVHRVFGADSAFGQAMRRCTEDPRAMDRGYFLPEIIEVLFEAHATVTHECLFNVAPQLLAVVGAESIEVAETLANAGELQAAARAAGHVLRSMLGRLAQRAGLEEPASPEAIADSLLEGGVLEPSTHLKIAACLQIAADAAGSRAGLIPDAELREQVRAVSDLTRRYRWEG